MAETVAPASFESGDPPHGILAAYNRHRRNTGAIFVLKLLLEWTMIGWVVAIV